ncbi:hypothetical protein [Stieleria varia]|uniref:Uncharacterized protein n=1 Tax=Stieleria varia TaxID=2528005 RepID=A0A5C6A5Q1_9BACT|nr:hypothetical protein [Stieleria varia]TWT94710.1 hypothetical protein Pla52n_55350 [Stieleria varia]
MNNPIFVHATIVTLTCCLSFGCSHHDGVLGVDCCADIPAGAIPAPAGSKVCQWQSAQVNSAIADQTVLYQADFIDRSATLSPAALQRLSRHAQTDLAAVQSWTIEPSGDAAVDTNRLASVLHELAIRGIHSPDVQLAFPAALGLSGPQAERAASALGNTRNSNAGIGAPISRPSGIGGTGLTGGFR